MDDKIVQYIESNGITFEIRALDSDGETIVKYTSQTSADDIAGDAWKIDEYIQNLALAPYEEEDWSGASDEDNR